MLLLGVVVDPALRGARWWSAPDPAGIAGALAFPIGLWLILVAVIIWLPIFARRPLSVRGAWIQSLLIAASSAIAWIPVALLLNDAVGLAEGPGVALAVALASGPAVILVAIWPRRDHAPRRDAGS